MKNNFYCWSSIDLQGFLAISFLSPLSSQQQQQQQSTMNLIPPFVYNIPNTTTPRGACIRCDGRQDPIHHRVTCIHLHYNSIYLVSNYFFFIARVRCTVYQWCRPATARYSAPMWPQKQYCTTSSIHTNQLVSTRSYSGASVPVMPGTDTITAGKLLFQSKILVGPKKSIRQQLNKQLSSRTQATDLPL